MAVGSIGYLVDVSQITSTECIRYKYKLPYIVVIRLFLFMEIVGWVVYVFFVRCDVCVVYRAHCVSLWR